MTHYLNMNTIPKHQVKELTDYLTMNTTPFFESLISARERMFNKPFRTYVSEAFADASEQFMKQLPNLKMDLLNQACDRSVNKISTSFSVNLNDVFEKMDASMYIPVQLPKRYQFILCTKIDEVKMFNSNTGCFTNPREHEGIVYYLNEFIPEIKAIKTLIYEHFDGDVTVECKIEPIGNNILFRYIISYNLEKYV